jgi:hypothetical protein
MKIVPVFTTLLAWVSGATGGLAQSDSVPKDIMDKLQKQPPAEERKMTVAPTTAPATAGSGQQAAEADKLRSLQNLLQQVERSRGAPFGTIKAVPGKDNTVSLQHDLAKVRENYSALTDAPFGEALSGFASDSPVANTSAVVEYNTRDVHDFAEKIVSIKAKDSVAANAFASGERPVSLKIANAKLSASQIPAVGEQLAVHVEVGTEMRTLNVGDVSRFANFEVTILASSNRSGKRSYEGLPYVLRLQVMPLQ